MGQVRQVEPVKFIVGILAIEKDLLPTSRELITQYLGAIDLCSPIWPFTSTKYYAEEMSDVLCRQFVSLSEPANPDRLVDMKLAANCAEIADAQSRGRSERRAINLDPGYITPAKLVLATTKDYSHRLYLDRGIYAETTLQFHVGQWDAWPWTYPDYAGPTYHDFFIQVRERLLAQLRDKNQEQSHLEQSQ